MENDIKTVGGIKDQIEARIESLFKLLSDLKLQVHDELPRKSDVQQYRIIHLKNNPCEIQVKQMIRDTNQLKQENETLTARLKLLELTNDMDVTRMSEDLDANSQVQELTQKVAELERKEAKILDDIRKCSREVREVCYLLMGYRVEALKDNVFRLSGMYAENESDQLLFKVTPDGKVQLLENSYSGSLSEYIYTYLEQADSFPAFMAAITLDQFKSYTQMSVSQSVSMSLSETIMPNSDYRPAQ